MSSVTAAHLTPAHLPYIIIIHASSSSSNACSQRMI